MRAGAWRDVSKCVCMGMDECTDMDMGGGMDRDMDRDGYRTVL